ncbi:MAG: tetratricopeptide repeat protein [Microcoleus sp. PH2017_10_PVI_O_A]|nr:tetratricopeptide repeat protein [Microcoleus sp. PH2017_10_PVI_O_A]MCC3459244.1 tetratricopeptide repeat protein [Microcoleus sp. PH2017_11_PCY_U_A]MCC3477440.1 tetratricopeptide repeat protein [Microcoleus sp. PH2017_12_PCY_D_A]MCC3528698.1 tetratricopeptide repeat protein [Microcoleus sp. PH2017_21_RUC_O_A]MCC3540817.1 tetratricopeptide repeat protein [Microcoleus sp. PH2017_22_RUC_O_B]MCC3558533.1 tetratricopeptide repeat protein [Microcoleus sp. PH2017_27_LUM_O_A]
MEFVSQADSNHRSELSRFFGYLQWTREGLREFPYPIVLWVTPNILSRLSREAPDFWSWRSGVFRFVAPVVQETGVVNWNGEISLLIEPERRETLPLDELLDQVENLEQQAMETPALATLYNRVANSYASLVNTRKPEDYSQELDRAIHFFDKSLALQRKLNLPQAESETLLELGDLYRDLGLWERVFHLYQQSLEIARSLKDSLGEAAALGRLGNLYQEYPQGYRANNLERAIASYDETRAQVYLQLINTLLNCHNGDEPQILQNNSELLDRGFLETCKSVAAKLTEQGGENGANFLRNLASHLGQFIDNRIRGESADNIEWAIAFYRNALEVYTLEAFPEYWAMTQNNLANAYSNRIRGERADNLEKAIAFYRNALEVYTLEAFPEYWAMTQNNLATAYSNRIRGERAENIERAIASYTAALSVYTPDAFPEYWARTQNNLGEAYSNRIRGERAENIERAKKCYENALTVRTREAFPQEHTETLFNLGNLDRNKQ